MVYSVKKFIETNCTKTYKLCDLDELAKNLSTYSCGIYTKSNALKVLCRYVCVVNNDITLCVDNRDIDQTFDKIKQKLSHEGYCVDNNKS